MIYEGSYDKVDLYSASKGMNQNVAPNLLKSDDYSTYIENMMPQKMGEGQVRYGTVKLSDSPTDTIVRSFPFVSAAGAKQQVLYMSKYEVITAPIQNLRITSANHVVVTNANVAKFEQDTLMKIVVSSPYGQETLICEIKSIASTVENTIDIAIAENSFTTGLQDFYINAVDPNPQRLSDSSFSITVPIGFDATLYYPIDGKVKLTIDDVPYVLDIVARDTAVPGTITFTTNDNQVPAFNDLNTRLFAYKSSTPEVIQIYYSVGYIKVLDIASNALLEPVIDNLSVACVPRAEFHANQLWIHNGVNWIMTWDGANLDVYEEPVKEGKGLTATRVDARNLSFSFALIPTFNVLKYAVGNKIFLPNTTDENGVFVIIATDVDAEAKTITITVARDLPDVISQSILYYMDKPPKFNYMKLAHDRLFCLGYGSVSLSRRIPDQAMRVYYSYRLATQFSEGGFAFFSEESKVVESIDLSTKQGIPDNLEAIVNLSGKLVFMGRQHSQVWSGLDPRKKGTADQLVWSANLPVGTYHGDLVIELANDAQFLTQNGFVSFGTLNIAKQYAASNTPNMDKLANQYMNTITSNYAYRACGSFKYDQGGFCGFKIGLNDIIVSKFHTDFFWWGIFSGDFTAASSFSAGTGDALYLNIGNEIYQYADGFLDSSIYYGDRGGTRAISFVETKYVNNIKKRYSNKRYEIDCEYSSDIVINPNNLIQIYISGNLRDTYILQDTYRLPQKGDLLGTITIVDGSQSGNDPDDPLNTSFGMRFDTPSHPIKGRLKFLSNNFYVSIAGFVNNGPVIIKKIRLLGNIER